MVELSPDLSFLHFTRLMRRRRRAVTNLVVSCSRCRCDNNQKKKKKCSQPLGSAVPINASVQIVI